MEIVLKLVLAVFSISNNNGIDGEAATKGD